MTDEQPAAAAPRPRRYKQALITLLAAATQNLAKRLHAQAGKAPPKDNPWQNVDRLQRQWLADFAQDPNRRARCGHRPDPAPRLPTSPRVGAQRRSDYERYQRETGEGSIGRRVRITPAFVDQALDAVVVLAGRLEATAR